MQRGSLKVINFRGVKVWRLQWRENGRPRTRILGRYANMTRDQAEAERKKTLAPLNARAESTTVSAVTLIRFVEDDYLTAKARVWKQSTRDTTEQIVRDHILHHFASRALPSLSRKELQAHLDHMAATGLSRSVVDHVRWQLVAIFDMALSDGLVTVNPATALVTPRCKDAGEKRTTSLDAMTKAEMVLDVRERLIVHLAVYHGMRPGEIAGLRVGDTVDGTVRVVRRIYRGVVDVPKSRKSRRPIPMMARTKKLLEQWVELLPDTKSEAWLFPSENGRTPISYSNVYRRNIRPALAKVGLGNINFLILRRTWVNEFSKTEKDATVRAQLAGHSVDVDENEYRQPQPEVLKRAMRRFEKRLQ